MFNVSWFPGISGRRESVRNSHSEKGNRRKRPRNRRAHSTWPRKRPLRSIVGRWPAFLDACQIGERVAFLAEWGTVPGSFLAGPEKSRPRDERGGPVFSRQNILNERATVVLANRN
ncbi:hypothetical protein CEXT_755941 [Caerostris extrusa]|uniref:Uncharacterized protein n=1 Tax=Caerostris extrusa TaxID=172846 RepID=A0AAV4RAS1_CAEEX|nr:hypothetical protein CEXT_755941 [Caerostris extrusa]